VRRQRVRIDEREMCDSLPQKKLSELPAQRTAANESTWRGFALQGASLRHQCSAGRRHDPQGVYSLDGQATVLATQLHAAGGEFAAPGVPLRKSGDVWNEACRTPGPDQQARVDSQTIAQARKNVYERSRQFRVTPGPRGGLSERLFAVDLACDPHVDRLIARARHQKPRYVGMPFALSPVRE